MAVVVAKVVVVGVSDDAFFASFIAAVVVEEEGGRYNISLFVLVSILLTTSALDGTMDNASSFAELFFLLSP